MSLPRIEKNQTPLSGSIRIGSFEVQDSTQLIVTDPCYDSVDKDYQHVIENPFPGIWNVVVEISDERSFGKRVSKLTAYHSEMAEYPVYGKHLGTIFVDSGQAGIFDKQYYRNDSIITDSDSDDFFDDNRWYCHVCTASANLAGIVKIGAVSSSGFGDGEYDVYIKSMSNGVVAVTVDYRLEDEDEDEDEDEYCDEDEDEYCEEYDD